MYCQAKEPEIGVALMLLLANMLTFPLASASACVDLSTVEAAVQQLDQLASSVLSALLSITSIESQRLLCAH